MRNIYDTIYSNEKNFGNLADSPRIRIMHSLLSKQGPYNKNILDIGCYDGTFLDYWQEKGNNLFGLDASGWAIERCLAKGIKAKTFFFDDVRPLPFEKSFFDFVIAGEIIEHIFDTDFFLREIWRVLKPGGKLLLSTPNLASLGRRIFLFIGKNPHIELSPNQADSSGHIRYFTFKTITELLEKNDFKVIGSKSDCINFSNRGIIRSKLVVKFFPTLGASIIVLSEKSQLQ